MVDDLLNRENVLAVSFSEHANAYEALSRLKELDAHGDVSVRALRWSSETRTGRW